MITQLKDPAYTGKNRCMACTIVNILIATLLAVMVSLIAFVYISSATAIVIGGAILAISLVRIWLKGYLVPGTPTLTKRYFPTWLLAWFGKAPQQPIWWLTEDAGGLEGEEIQELLVRTNVIEPCQESSDLCLSEKFQSDWEEVIATANPEPTVEEVTSILGAESKNATLNRYGNAITLSNNNDQIAFWPSQSSLRADLASGKILQNYIDSWEDYSIIKRGQILHTLRLFFEECPNGGKAEMTEETVESCCSSHEVVAVVCQESGERLFEQPISG